MRFLRSRDTLSLFLHDMMTCMHISKNYNEIHGGKTILTIRKHAKILTTPHKFRPKTLDSTDSVDFTHFKRTVNRYCVSGCLQFIYSSLSFFHTLILTLILQRLMYKLFGGYMIL